MGTDSDPIAADGETMTHICIVFCMYIGYTLRLGG